MKVKCKVPQPSPDEIISEFFETRKVEDIFIHGDYNNLTDDGKALLALGIVTFTQFQKIKRSKK